MRKQTGTDAFDTDRWQLKAAKFGQAPSPGKADPSGMSPPLSFSAWAQGAAVSCISSYRLWSNRGVTKRKNMNI